MINLQIDMGQMPPTNWTIMRRDVTHSSAVSHVVTPQMATPAKSLRASEAHVAPPVSLEDKLFENAATLKVGFSKIAMHLTPEWRTVIFSQIDALIDFDNWQDNSSFIQEPAFTTFLRFIIFSLPTRLPSLGVSQAGNLLAAWYDDLQRIAVEFFPDDKVVGTFVKQGPRGNETATWRGPVTRLRHFIEQFGIADCMYDAHI